MRLIQSFAVIRVSATANFSAATKFHFYKPVGIGECLARHANNIRVTAAKNLFGLFESSDAAGGDDWLRKSSGIDCTLGRAYQWNPTPQRPPPLRTSIPHPSVTP